ncbi:MAG TPA: DNA polymerase III subunit delta' [Stellaceae bacterium]|nr:DNA polymerase III subunit delta' [Stellaceae bacterium]
MARSVEPPPETASTVPPPRANPDLVGHEGAERELRRLDEIGRLPHAILLSGPRGIGKATLAFRLARFLLASGEERNAVAERGLAIHPESGVFRRVAAGGHADLLTIERAYDARRRRLRGEIVVEDAREITGFFRLTAAEEGWRIVVVDGADEMNRSAANALLKVLEEPPRRALLLLVSHSPGRLLPTIRSRCRRFPLTALERPAVMQLLRRYRPELDEPEAEALAMLCEGSVGRALEIADAGGLPLYGSIVEMLSQVPVIDLARLHAFADQLARADAEDGYRAGAELLSQFLARMAAGAARRRLGEQQVVAGESAAMQRLAARADPARWAALREEIGQGFATADQLNLDRKQAMLGAFFAIEKLAR